MAKGKTNWTAVGIGLAAGAVVGTGYLAYKGVEAAAHGVGNVVDAIRHGDNATLVDTGHPYSVETDDQVIFRSDTYQPKTNDPHQA